METQSSQDTQRQPTNYEAYVLEVIGTMTRSSSRIDQNAIRQCLLLSSSYLVSDTTMNPTSGIISWSAGLNHLVDILTVLHTRDELELETVNAASKACSECWTVAGNWRGMEECRDSVRRVAVRLKRLLDENGRTFGGERVYVP
ncbi:hypothetical protein BGW80DRAFT_1283245 [Lactifluus volemus]|nr:hypothetical protein BGW80DRAFT_1283245 [Lactifluus volemus]